MPFDDPRIELADRLLELEALLRNRRLWCDEPPSDEALASDQPFAVDTLVFTEWLQFIFIPRLHQLVEQGEALPAECDVAPMAEEFFRAENIEPGGVIRQLRAIDVLITENE